MKAPTVKDAKVTVFMAWNRFKAEPFKVDLRDSPEAKRKLAALKLAEKHGWIWFMMVDRCCVTNDGRKALSDFGVEAS